MQKIKNGGAKVLARIGIIACLYIVLSLVSLPVGYVQLRVSEGLTILPLIIPESAVALGIGCLLTNLITGCAVLDILLGSLITLFSAFLTMFTAKIIKKAVWRVLIGGFFPVILNAFLLPLIWLYCYGTGEYVYYVQVLLLLASQSLSVYGVGSITYGVSYKLLLNEKA